MRFRTLLLPATLVCILFAGTAHAGPCDAHFTFDGNLNDASGNGYDGRLIGKGGGAADGAASYGEGRNGQALLLSGVYAVRAPVDLSKAACPQVTVAAWVRMDDDPTKGTQDIFSSGRGGPRFDRVGTHLEVRSGNQRQLVSNGLRGGRWEFIATVIDQEAGKMTVYWRQRSFERDMKPVGTDSADIWIGALDDDLRNPVLAGAIDDVRIYGQLLTANQIKQIQVGTPRRPGSTQGPGDELNPNLGLWTPGDQAAVVNHEEQYSAPGIGDGTAEVGVMPKPTGLAQPPDIGDGTAEAGVLPKLFGDPDLPPDIGDGRVVADAEQRVMSGQTDALPGSGNLDGSSDAPTSLMPGGSRGTDLSSNKSLQEAVSEKEPLDLTYDSEEEGEAAAAAGAARRQQEADEKAMDDEPVEEAPSGYSLASTSTKTKTSGYSGESVEPMDFVTEAIVKIDILKGSVGLASKPLGVRIWSKSGQQRKVGGGSEKQMTVDLGQSAVITMRACRNLSNKRVVGIEIDGRELLENGDFGAYRKDTDKRDSCNNTWGSHAKCPSGSVATGVYVHHKPATMDFDSLPDKVIGLQLICRSVIPNN